MPLNDPLGSSAFDVLERNTSDMDKFISQPTGTVTTRLGEALTPLPVRNAELLAAVQATGWFIAGTFASGFTFTARNQVGRDSTGELWSYNGSTLPFSVSAGTVPSEPTYTNRGDAALRSALALGTADIAGESASNIVKAISKVFTPEMFMPSGSPTVSQITQAIRDAIIAASGGGKVIASGSYSVNPMIFYNDEVNNVEIDFLGSDVRCVGPRTLGTVDDWEYGVLSFFGSQSGISQTLTFSSIQLARTTTWQVTDSSAFSVGDYWEVEINPSNTTDFSNKLVWRLLMVTKIINSTTVGFDYQRAFDIPSGTEVVYRKINPIKGISVKNLNNLIYDRSYTTGSDPDRLEASSGVTFYYAVNCSIDKLQYVRNPKQAAHFELSNNCHAKEVKMLSPVEFEQGGYCVQFEKSTNWSVTSCKSAKDRHLFDATASSNGIVEDCDGWETSNATFTTHGTYEHDIVYERNKGHFQLAGSGPAFGETALNITVRDHVGTIYRGVAPNIRDISIYDSTFNSTMDATLDGLFLQNVTTKNNCRFTAGGNYSQRKNMAINCSLNVGAAFMNASGKELLMVGGKILNPRRNTDVLVAGGITSQDTDWLSTSTSNSPVTVQMEKLHIYGGIVSGVPFVFAGGLNQSIVINPSVIDKGSMTNAVSLVRLQKPSANINLTYSPIKSLNTDRHITAIDTENDAVTTINIANTEFVGGSIRVDAGALNGGFVSRLNPKYNGCTVQYPAPSLTTYSIGEYPTIYGQQGYTLNLVDGDSTQVTVSCSGVTLNDAISKISYNVNMLGAKMRAEITDTDEVTVYFSNDTGSTISTGSGIIRVACEKFS